MRRDPDLAPPDARLEFPYMFWAHTSSSRSRYTLSQSGMPAPESRFFEGLGPFDVGHPSAEALPEFERRIAERDGLPPSRVLAALGGSGGMHLCAMRYFRPGARVVVDVPSYEPFRSLPAYFGAELIPVRRRMEDGWRLDPDVVRRSLARGRGAGHVFVANPHNPSGALLDREEIAALAAEAARAGGHLIVCEVYMEYLPPPARVLAHALAENAISIGSLTKAYGLGALRAGWIALGSGLESERTRLQDMAYLAYVDPPTACLRAAISALDRLAELALPIARIERESRPMWERWLRDTPEIESTVPPYGIIAFPRVRGVDDTLALAESLAREHDVDVVPGEFFGQPGHVRVGCGVPAATLEDGLARLTRGIRAFTPSARA